MRQQLSLCLLTITLLLAMKALAAGQTYSTIDFPGSVENLATDINDFGQIVGEYTLSTSLADRTGFLLSNGVFTSITYPSATSTRALGINRNGDIVGDHQKAGNNNGVGNAYGYLLQNGSFTSIQFPNSDATTATGINANGDVVGWYFDKVGTHGFLLTGGVYSTIDYPGAAAFTELWKINDAGLVAGRYKSAIDGKYHVFILENGVFTTIPEVPGAAQTAPGNFSETGGLSQTGDIAGHYCSSNPCQLGGVGNLHGFLFSGGVYTTFDFPSSVLTMAFGVNSSDQVVGGYQDTSGVFHGYLRTP